MPRPIPATAAPKLIELLRQKNYKDMTDFATRNEINPGSFHSLCTDSTMRPLRIYSRIAAALSIHAAGCSGGGCNCPGRVSLEDIYQAFTADDISYRRDWLISKLAPKDIASVSELARISKVSKTTISDIVTGKNNCSTLHTYKAVSNGLGIDLDAFAHLFI